MARKSNSKRAERERYVLTDFLIILIKYVSHLLMEYEEHKSLDKHIYANVRLPLPKGAGTVDWHVGWMATERHTPPAYPFTFQHFSMTLFSILPSDNAM
jgi:hypothetical protein